ncbi:hypothetical protein JCM8547_005003 [Rhodosporidiobolus lusitaniae]
MSRDPDEPLRVSVVVYDLLPPSRLASILNFCGSGVYHSSVQLSIPLGPTDLDPSPYEYAFGGHDQLGVSGIFSIPSGTSAQRMPGLRHYLEVDMGEAFGEDWDKAFRPKQKNEGVLSRVSSRATMASVEEDPFKDPQGEELEDEDDGGISDGTEYLTKAERRAWRIVQAMRKDEEWNGTKYRLLEKNCNTFTHELVFRLTGRKAPAWLNRAAWVATSVPCIVPAGWIDEVEEEAPTAESTSPSSAQSTTPTSAVHLSDPAHALSKDGNVTIAPPRADRMELGGRY